MTDRQPEHLEDEHQRKFRRIFTWVFFFGILGMCIITLYFAIKAAFLAYHGTSGELAGYHGISPQLAIFFRETLSRYYWLASRCGHIAAPYPRPS